MKKKPTQSTTVVPPDPRWDKCKHKNQCLFLPLFNKRVTFIASGYTPNKKYCYRCSLFLDTNEALNDLQVRDALNRIKKEKSRLESNEEKLRRFAESDEYREDFAKLKKEILARKPPLIARCVRIDSLSNPEERMARIVQNDLKKGNINNHHLQIPPSYKAFTDRWGLNLFFDPTQSYPKNFMPFNWVPITISFKQKKWNPDDPDRFKLTMKFDVRMPLLSMIKSFKWAIKTYKELILVESRRERYKEEELNEIKELLNKGMNKINIFRHKCPQFTWFNPRKDYLFKPEEERTTEDWDAWASYNRIGRLVDRAKAEK